MKTIRELFIKLGLNVDEAKFATAMTAVEGLKVGLESVVAVAQRVANVTLEIAKDVVNTGSHLDDLSKRFGVNTDRLQEFAFAGSMSGVSMDELATAMGFIARKTGKDVGPELERIADVMASLPSDSERAKYAFEHLGRSGMALVPMLKGGSSELRNLKEEAKSLGGIMDTETVTAADEVGDAIDKVKFAARGVSYSIAKELLPDVLEITKSLLGWWKANRKDVTSGLRRIIDVGKKVIGVVVDLVGMWKVFAVVLASVVGAAIAMNIGQIMLAASWYAALSVQAIASGLATAAAWAAAVWPFIAIAAAIALVILAIDEVMTFMRGGDTLLGEFGQQWTNWLTELLKYKEDDFFLVKALKLVLRLLTDFGGEMNKFEKWFQGTTFGKWIAEMSKGAAAAEAKRQEIEDKQRATSAANMNAAFGFLASGAQKSAAAQKLRDEKQSGASNQALWTADRALMPHQMFGAGASPAATVAKVAGGVDAWRAQTTNTVNMTVHAAPGMSEEQVGKIAANEVANALGTEKKSAVVELGLPTPEWAQ